MVVGGAHHREPSTTQRKRQHFGVRADLDASTASILRLAKDVEVAGVELELPEASDMEMVEVLKRAIAN